MIYKGCCNYDRCRSVLVCVPYHHQPDLFAVGRKLVELVEILLNASKVCTTYC